MADIFEYLRWRGDISFQQSPLNPVDNIIFSQLAYFPFEGVVPSGQGASITIAAAAERLDALGKSGGLSFICKDDPRLLEALASSKRFGNLPLMGCVNHIDISAEKQFAAITILTGKHSAFIAYRGTDLSLVGWKEDLNMAFSPVIPSQIEAVSYLREAAAWHPWSTFALGGHSKGGNLACYAAAFSGKRIQKRITAIYSNDGPGFLPEIRSSPGYQAVSSRIQSFVPQDSVVGLLFEHDSYTVIKSSQSGLMEHDLYSWETARDSLIRLDRISPGSRFIDKTLKEWVYALSPAERRNFVDALYHVISATKAASLMDLGTDGFKNAAIILQSLGNLDEKVKSLILKTLSALFKAARNNIPLLMNQD